MPRAPLLFLVIFVAACGNDARSTSSQRASSPTSPTIPEGLVPPEPAPLPPIDRRARDATDFRFGYSYFAFEPGNSANLVVDPAGEGWRITQEHMSGDGTRIAFTVAAERIAALRAAIDEQRCLTVVRPQGEAVPDSPSITYSLYVDGIAYWFHPNESRAPAPAYDTCFAALRAFHRELEPAIASALPNARPATPEETAAAHDAAQFRVAPVSGPSARTANDFRFGYAYYAHREGDLLNLVIEADGTLEAVYAEPGQAPRFVTLELSFAPSARLRELLDANQCLGVAHPALEGFMHDMPSTSYAFRVAGTVHSIPVTRFEVDEPRYDRCVAALDRFMAETVTPAIEAAKRGSRRATVAEESRLREAARLGG